jgi:hypothetical protein
VRVKRAARAALTHEVGSRTRLSVDCPEFRKLNRR